ncbi:MAG: PDZ domain-containing protein [Phycisphaerales bacterium]|nr:PDZ domain-containing protein [Phycisphaerales bacterium]
MARLPLLALICMFGLHAMPAAAQVSEQDRLEQRIVRTFGAGRYDRALEEVDAYLARWPETPHMHYNRACALALLGRKDAAAEALVKAVDYGFLEFEQMKRDPDMDSMRDHPTYLAILEARQRVDRGSSDRQVERWKTRYGEDGYTFESDDKRRLHFVTSVDGVAHAEMKRMLQRQVDQMADSLFQSPPDYWCLVAVPTSEDAADIFPAANTSGIYLHDSRRLISRDIGSSMRHEFAHLMHYGHMERLGQKHAMWVQEGLASLYEDYTLSANGEITFVPNLRHNIARKQIERRMSVPWKKMMELDGRSFLAGDARYYPQVRSMFEFLAHNGVLEEWYRTYTETFDRSPNGSRAWEETFRVPLDTVEERWRQWVLGRGRIDDRIDYGDASIGISGVDAGDGVRIERIVGSAARRAGLRRNDVIVAVNGNPVRSQGELMLEIARKKVGDVVRLRIRRGAAYQDARVILEPLDAVIRGR